MDGVLRRLVVVTKSDFFMLGEYTVSPKWKYEEESKQHGTEILAV